MEHSLSFLLSQEQLVFIYDAILESVLCGNTQISAANLRSKISKYNEVDSSAGVTKFKLQFNVSVCSGLMGINQSLGSNKTMRIVLVSCL